MYYEFKYANNLFSFSYNLKTNLVSSAKNYILIQLS